jgi:hypothetical protein
MKNLFVLSVLICIICICSCKDNIPTDPIANLSKPSSEIIHDKIQICCELLDPMTGVCGLNGCAEYTHQLINGPTNPNGLYTILLSFQMYSELCSRCMMMHPDWIIRGYNEETVNVSEEGIVLVTKLYEITNRFDIVLKVTYLVTTNGAGIAEVMIVPMQPL